MVRFKLKFLCFIGMLGVLTWHCSWAQPNHPQAHAENNRFTSQHPYSQQINLGGFYGTGNSSYGQLDTMLPLLQSQRQMMFLDVRGLHRQQDQTEVNAGLGYRWLSQDFNRLYGLYIFFDNKHTQHNFNFQQLTFGAEFKTGRFSMGVNGYIPVGDRKKKYNTSTLSQSVTPFLQAQTGFSQIVTGSIVEDSFYEKALGGFDAEVGFTLVKRLGLRALAGGFYFSAKGATTVAGPRGTLLLNVLSPWTNKSYLKPRLEFESSVQYDKPRGTTWYAGARLSVSFGGVKEQQLTGMQREMTSFIRRDLDVVTENEIVESHIESYKYYSKADGTPYRVKVVSTEEDLASATDSVMKIDIIGVDGSVTLAGHNSITSSSKALVNLQANQILTTGVFSFVDGGVAKSLQIGKSGVLEASGAGHLIAVSNDATATNTIQNVQLIVNDASQYAAITNIAGQLSDYTTEGDHSFATVTINNVTSNGSLFFALDNSNESGAVVAITNSRITFNGGAEDAIALKGMGLTAEQKINDNTLTVAQANRAIYIEGDVAGSVDGNELTLTQATYGISVDGHLTSTASIYNNTITSQGNAETMIRVNKGVAGRINSNTVQQTNGSLEKMISVGGQLTGSVDSNTLTYHAPALALSKDLKFIEVSGAVGDQSTEVAASIDSNSLIFNSSLAASNTIYGIVAIDSVYKNATISSNVIDVTANTGNSMAGVVLSSAGVVQLYGKVDKNTISIQNTADNNVAADVYGITSLLLTGTGAATSFSENTISLQATSASLFGIKFTDLTSSKSTFLGNISNNTLALTSNSGNNAIEEVSAISISNIIPNLQIIDNTITTTLTGKASGDLNGIKLLWTDVPLSTNTYSTPLISGNKITSSISQTAIESELTVYGIEFSTDQANLFMAGSIENNTINITTKEPLGIAESFSITGVQVVNPRSDGAAAWSISNNKITLTASGTAPARNVFGMYIRPIAPGYSFTGSASNNNMIGNTVTMEVENSTISVSGLIVNGGFADSTLTGEVGALTISNNIFNITAVDGKLMYGVFEDGVSVTFFNSITQSGNAFTFIGGPGDEWQPNP